MRPVAATPAARGETPRRTARGGPYCPRRRAQRGSWRGLLGIGLLALLAAGCGGPDRPLDWPAVDALISSAFPDTPSLTTAELAAALAANPSDVVLLDAREAEEFAVSHLPGAHHVGDDADAAGRVAAAAPGARVVVYCSVGYRSAALVGRLRERGHANAVNLDGSIFRWAGEGRPVYRGDARVEQVHPYDDRWGALLPRSLWAYAPPAAAP